MAAAPPPALTEAVTSEAGGDEFEDVVDTPYAQDGQKGGLLDGEGDNLHLANSEFVIEGTSSAEDGAFDLSVAALQELSASDEFQSVLKQFCADNSHHFEDTEENKLIYTDIFKAYSALIESHLKERMGSTVEGFSMEAFLAELGKRGEAEIDHDVFELLVSLGNFDTFKQRMLACGLRRPSLTVMGVKSKLHEDDDEDGDVRDDLDDLLLISPATPSASKGMLGGSM
eukprot:TRINITY_DN6195_c1_g1_i1.p1 TRINITY_DN6195_c1_g1~~TRINITY_DN6195_c1_g1_i1.p1  ORF type:complete len:256 (-),score=54.44 TRINITY_DN6195_c1_g1_i1:135-818(-)